MPYFIIVKLFFALFGLSSERDVMLTPENPDNIKYFQVKIVCLGNILLFYILLSLSSFCTCWSPRSSSSTFWSLWCPTLTREYRFYLIYLTTTFLNQNKNICLSATIRHGVEIWEIKIDNVSENTIFRF